MKKLTLKQLKKDFVDPYKHARYDCNGRGDFWMDRTDDEYADQIMMSKNDIRLALIYDPKFRKFYKECVQDQPELAEYYFKLKDIARL